MNTGCDLIEAGRRVLAEQPLSVLLGAELIVVGPGPAELKLTVRREHLQHYGVMLGGALSDLPDNALTCAGGSALAGHAMVTSEYMSNHLRPALGAALIARATAQGATVPVGKSSD